MQRVLLEVESLRSALGSTLGEITVIEPIESGTTGHSYRIDTMAGRYVAKVFSPESDALLGPQAQFELLTRLGPAAIAPKPAACIPSAGVLVTQYLPAAVALSPVELHRANRIHAIADLLGRLHRNAVGAPRYEPASYAGKYLDRLGGLERLSPINRERGAEMLAIANSLNFDNACLCHNDLTADNILFGRSPMLIDFDYAALAPPVLDLASVSVMNHFAPAEDEQLLAAYRSDSNLPDFLAEFATLKCLVRLLSHFWSLASRDAGAAIVSKYRIDDV